VVADGVAIEAGQTLDPGARIMPNERVPA
jgi:hypothetical protein